MIKRYISEKSATITNSFKSGLILRATGSNTGLADSMEIFHIYAQQSSASSENSRALVEFPISSISTDRTSGIIPSSGSVNFYLNLYNAVHPFTLPRKFYLAVTPVSRSWNQGSGIDLDEHTDSGIVNWTQASSNSSGITNWSDAGGDYWSGSYFPSTNLPHYSYYFENGYENINLDVTSLVEEWINGTYPNYGILLRLSGSEDSVSSSYTKRFHTQTSEYFFLRPSIEARWDDSEKDHRSSFIVSSSNLLASDNINTIFLYNYYRGQLKNIAHPVSSGSIYVQVWDDRISGSQITTSPVTGGCISTGVYTASFSLYTTSSYIYDRWLGPGLSTTYHTGTIKINNFDSTSYNPNPKYIINMPNLKDAYSSEEITRLRLYTRQRNWSPNIYTVINSVPETEIIEDMYYKVIRITDNFTCVEYGTGSSNHTRLSYDVSGSYFDFDMGLLESGYMYGFKYVIKHNSNFIEQKEIFKFRVD